MLGSFALTILLLYVPPLRNAFGFEPISLAEFGIALVLAFLVIPIVEIVKLIQRAVSKK